MAGITNKRQFTIGLVGLIAFTVVLVTWLSPIFNGQNGLEAADSLFNSLAKQSSYYIPDVAKKADQFRGEQLDVTIKAKSADVAEKTGVLFEAAGADVTVSGTELKVSGDLGAISAAALADADTLFTKGETGELEARYGIAGREAVYHWYNAFKAINKKYLKENKGKEVLFTKTVITKALEPAYNFAGIPPAAIGERVGITVFLLVFYVVYTIWYGFSIMYIFEGLGITAKAGEKKEA